MDTGSTQRKRVIDWSRGFGECLVDGGTQTTQNASPVRAPTSTSLFQRAAFY